MAANRNVEKLKLQKLHSADMVLNKPRLPKHLGPYKQMSDTQLIRRKTSKSSNSGFTHPHVPWTSEVFNTMDKNKGRAVPMCYFYHFNDQEDLEEDPDEVNNNEVEEGDTDKDETASVGSSQHSGKQIKEKTGRSSTILHNMKKIAQFWRTIVVLLTPIVLSPLLTIGTSEASLISIVVLLTPIVLSPLLTIGTSEARCGYVILLMATYWVTEAIPLPVTALLPIILFPVLGIMSTDDVCVKYLKESNMMFIGGLIVAIAVEHCRLHQRIALRVLLLIGTSPRLLMLGFMLPTMFLSMWISNTATTAMMVPIVEAVLTEINAETGLDAVLEESDDDHNRSEAENKLRKEKLRRAKRIRVMIYLSIAYAANCGGTGTLTGTGPNLVLKGMLASLFGSETPVNFATWMGFACPIMLFNLFLTWIWLQYYFMGAPWGKNKMDIGNKETLRRVLKEKYEGLGPMNFHQAAVLVNFSILILLWFFRDPQFIPGWGEYFLESVLDVCGHTKYHQLIDDASAALFIVLILFIFPSKLTFWPFVPVAHSKPAPALIDWRTIHDRFPWGVMILFGGGFALADGSKVSGLSDWVGTQLSVLDSMPSGAVVLVICLMTGIITEVTSNVATANILLPVLAELAKSTHTNPLYLMIPATVTCSFAFMLPVATPPNAIVFSASGMNTGDMIKVGALMNVLCIGVAVLAVNTYGVYMFKLDEFPEWAMSVKPSDCNSTMT